MTRPAPDGRERREQPDLSPPWVLFSDKGKPVAILPAMRPGEVANVSHLTIQEAQDIVSLANTLHNLLMAARLAHLEASIRKLVNFTKAPEDGAEGGEE